MGRLSLVHVSSGFFFLHIREGVFSPPAAARELILRHMVNFPPQGTQTSGIMLIQNMKNRKGNYRHLFPGLATTCQGAAQAHPQLLLLLLLFLF